MKQELEKIRELDEILQEFENRLELRDTEDMNTIKIYKNHIYDRSCRIFSYNLKRLILIEGTQKKLARRIGISEDLLSKYKSTETFPSIETLLFICKVYGIELNQLIDRPLSAEELDRIENGLATMAENIFETCYYVYFFVTNAGREGAIHEGMVEIGGNTALFKILTTRDYILKEYKGRYNISGKLIHFQLENSRDGSACVSMMKPNLSRSKYTGGLALLMLPSDANSKPCAQKILFSDVRIDREKFNEELKGLLSIRGNSGELTGNVKITAAEDEYAYGFVNALPR